MATVYLLFSETIDSFYIGSCNNFNSRFQLHIEKSFSFGYTIRADDWKLYYKVDNLEYKQARRIESHIKKMKSKKYNMNLLKYPEIMKRLVEKYK